MRATGFQGWISDVALALIEQAGRNPAEVFREELEASLHDGRHGHFGCEGYLGSLFCHHGVLSPYFTFRQGCYNDGTLAIDGTYPQTFALAEPGRPLSQFVDHPAFKAAGAIVTHAEHTEERLTLHHNPRLIPVEEAERRWVMKRR